MARTILARRSALLPLVAIAVLACGGGEASTDAPAGDDPDPSGAAATLAPAGERSFFTYDAFTGQVIRVDPDAGEITPITDREGPAAFAMTAGGGSFWLGLQSGDIVRIDPENGSAMDVTTGATDAVHAMAFGDDGVWAIHGAPGLPGAITRVDPATGTVTFSEPSGEGVALFDVAAGEGSGWVVGSSPTLATTVYKVDPATGGMTDLEVQMVIDSIDVGHGALWLGGTGFPDGMTGVPAIGRYDLASGQLELIEVDGEAGSIVVGPEAVWAVAGVTPDGMAVYRIDPATNEVVATIPLGEGDSGSVAISTGAGYVWVNSTRESWAIDPSDDTVAGDADSVGTMGLFFP